MRYRPLEGANLDWQNDAPYAEQFDDIYFSKAGGIAETQHVFLDGNNLPARWQNKQQFTICETGFGTGLNFLCTADLWSKTSKEGQWLHYISIEKHPIDKDRLKRIYQGLPFPLTKKLHAALPPIIPGFFWHRFEEERITLLLIQSDLATALQELSATIDAWFLDGFSPAKNPEMWSTELFNAMQKLSAEDATCATFTAASIVRKGLTQAGFEWERPPGFGHKRHMLKATRNGTNTKRHKDNSTIVIGGGLAGSAAANSLAQQNASVTLIERHGELAQEASGNQAAVLKPYLAKHWEGQTLLYNQAFYYARNQARKYDFYNETGSFHLENAPRHEALKIPAFHAQSMSAEEASKQIGLEVTKDAVFQAESGWINPSLCCARAINHPRIKAILSTEALTIAFDGTNWRVNDQYEAANLVIANAVDALAFEPTKHLPLVPIRGQISHFPKTKPLKHIVTYGGYALPNGVHITLGATYDRRDNESGIRQEDHAKNIAAFNDAFKEPILEKPIGGRVSWRTTTPSKRPIVGHLGQGLYVSLALGSRGALLAPYLAEQLAAELLGTPQPLQKSVKKLLEHY